MSVVPGFLRPIDTDALARELELKKSGLERGKKNLPTSDETELDGVEQTITQRIVSEWTYQGDELINNLRAYNVRLVGYSIHTEQAQLGLRLARNLKISARSTAWPDPHVILREDGLLMAFYSF